MMWGLRACSRGHRRSGAVVALVVGLTLVTGCQWTGNGSGSPPVQPSAAHASETLATSESSTSPSVVLMPDLIGMPSSEGLRRLGELELSSSWERPIEVRCGRRPGTIAWQRPAPGTPLTPSVGVRVRTASLNLEVFRGPCSPPDGDLGPLRGPDVRPARAFYRFAADPSLGAPFAAGETWVGIEDGRTSISLDEAERQQMEAWELGTGYAEASGPFSVLDTLAASGGYYQLRRGIPATCPRGDADPPPHLADARAISLTAPADVTSSCMEWWGVTLFLDPQSQIQGVALRLGSP